MTYLNFVSFVIYGPQDNRSAAIEWSRPITNCHRRPWLSAELSEEARFTFVADRNVDLLYHLCRDYRLRSVRRELGCVITTNRTSVSRCAFMSRLL